MIIAALIAIASLDNFDEGKMRIGNLYKIWITAVAVCVSVYS